MKFIARRCLAVPLWPALALAVVFALTVVTTQSAQAQTFSVIHNFSGQDGAAPIAGVTMDKAGSLYGTASSGGDYGVGIAFRLSHKGSGWVFTPLYSFQGNDGVSPQARVIFGPNGGLYGTTTAGGNGSGTVFELTPYPTACKSALCGWNETVLYRFTGGSDGAVPGYGDLAFDQAGNLYGTTEVGGGSGCTHHNGCGTVYKLTPSNGGWAESVLYSFQGRGDGDLPFAGVILDQAGNLYGTTAAGGNLYCNFGQEGCGVVYELTRSGSGWAESVLYAFRGGSGPDGLLPFGGLIFDQSGNLYGTTNDGGANYGGTVYELTPSNGGWTFAVLYSLGGNHGPLDSLVMDAAGNLYGTTVGDAMYGGRQHGTVFKLTPSSGGWIYTGLHAFTGGSDGGSPYGSVILDASGNLYGTASGGGAYGKGVVWEITP